MVSTCRQAVARLQDAGMKPTLINARSAKPLDETLLAQLVSENKVLYTVEEGQLAGGFGSAVLEWAARTNNLGKAKIKCLGIADAFVEHGARGILLDDNGLSAAKIASFVQDECQ
jgi:1-deoxy-D-xylulose-5-phosphate synthase